jgi:hypothetical protein
VDFDTVAAELYGLPPDEFIAVRDERAAQARAAGERSVASAVKRLRRPAVSAWLANLLARERAERLEELLELGDAFREAQANHAARDLRRLSSQRRRLVAELGRDARRLAADIDRHVSVDATRELEATLEAAVALPAAAQSVRRGRLTKPLSYSGIGESDIPLGAQTPGTQADDPAPAGAEPGAAGTPAADDREDSGSDSPAARSGMGGRKSSRRSHGARAAARNAAAGSAADPAAANVTEPDSALPDTPSADPVAGDGPAGETAATDAADEAAPDDPIVRRSRRRGFRSGDETTASATERHRRERFESARRAHDDAAEVDREATSRANADQQAATAANDRLERARDDVRDLEERLRRAQDEQAAAVRQARTTQKARASSARRAEEARRGLDRARQVVDRLRP